MVELFPQTTEKEILKMIRETTREKTRFIILYRDQFTCQICGERDYSNSMWRKYSSHQIHHIYTNQNNDHNNLVTLCPKCHLSIHKGNWRNSPKMISFSLYKLDRQTIENALIFKEIIDFNQVWGKLGFHYIDDGIVRSRESTA